MTTNSAAEVRAQLELSESQLLSAIGADLAGRQALPLTREELIARAQRWLAAQREMIDKQICSNNRIKEFALADSDTLIIAVEAAKLLAGLFLPVNPVTLATLLAKKGLKAVCATSWAPTKSQEKSATTTLTKPKSRRKRHA